METACSTADMERRMVIRYKVSVPATVHSPLEEIPAEMKELSIMGARIRSQRLLLPETTVKIYLDLDQTVLFVGEIVWVLTCFENDGKCFHEAGLRIHEIAMPGLKATGLAARAEVLPDILLSIKASEDFTLDRTA
ncbi:MAG: PilZ domain-containing protein [Desulfobacteraceae bacterium]|nr:PilZ domain-containing protein [Desulfobacteraceae bacterium]